MRIGVVRRRGGVVGVSVVAGAVLAAAVGGAPALAASGSGVRVPAGDASWTARATPAGAVPAGATLDVEVVLGLSDPAGAEAYARAVSTPGGATYGKYLAPQEFARRYAPSAATVGKVEQWLRGAGLTVVDVPGSRRWVRARGTEASIRTAFGTGLRAYRLGGLTMHAPDGAVTVPADIAGAVAGVTGLTSSTRLNAPSRSRRDRADVPGKAPGLTPAATGAAAFAAAPLARAASTAGPARLGVAPPPDAFVNATPCSAYWAQKVATDLPPAYGKAAPYAPCGYVGSQLRSAYDLTPGLRGGGATVAVVDAYAAPTIVDDANAYAVRHGGKPFARKQFTQYTPSAYSYGYEDQVNGDLCGENGWYGEETLDVEAVHAVAPAASVTYVAGASCQDADLLAAINVILDHRLANVVSDSWGDAGELDPVADAAVLEAYRQTFLQAAIEGIGMFFSSGDEGDEVDNTGVRSADFPASSPWVTAVGGTTLGVGRDGARVLETGWGTSKSTLVNGAWTPEPPGAHLYGSGGGTSRLFDQPWYQRGIVPSSISRYFGGTPGRAVPDVAAVGDPTTGFLVGETQTFPDGAQRYSEYRIGGTSLSSPVFAAVEAIADSAQGRRHGFANPAIYRLRTGLHDVRSIGGVGIVRSDFVNGVDASDGLVFSLRTADQTQTLHTRRGYDDVTGLGTPDGAVYASRLGR